MQEDRGAAAMRRVLAYRIDTGLHNEHADERVDDGSVDANPPPAPEVR